MWLPNGILKWATKEQGALCSGPIVLSVPLPHQLAPSAHYSALGTSFSHYRLPTQGPISFHNSPKSIPPWSGHSGLSSHARKHSHESYDLCFRSDVRSHVGLENETRDTTKLPTLLLIEFAKTANDE